MIRYHCDKCGLDNEAQRCASCGKALSGQSYRNIWCVERVPASDTLVWKTAVCVLFSLTGLLLVILLLMCVLEQRPFTEVISALPALLAVPAGGVLLVLAVLLAQGREYMWYTLENTGVRLHVWHRPGCLRSWARLQSYDRRLISTMEDGTPLFSAGETRLAWRDITAVKLQPRVGRILLFRTPHLAPLILRIPEEEYQISEGMIKKACRKVLS